MCNTETHLESIIIILINHVKLQWKPGNSNSDDSYSPANSNCLSFQSSSYRGVIWSIKSTVLCFLLALKGNAHSDTQYLHNQAGGIT